MKYLYALTCTLCTLACLLLTNSLPAQHLQVINTKFYCNNVETTFSEINDIIQTKDKGFAFVGKTGASAAIPGGILPYCGPSNGNPVMGKLDSLGNIEWIKNYCDTPTRKDPIEAYNMGYVAGLSSVIP